MIEWKDMRDLPTDGTPLLVWGYTRGDYAGRRPVVREATYQRYDRTEYKRVWFGFYRKVTVIGKREEHLTVGNHAVHFTTKGWMKASDLLQVGGPFGTRRENM